MIVEKKKLFAICDNCRNTITEVSEMTEQDLKKEVRFNGNFIWSLFNNDTKLIEWRCVCHNCAIQIITEHLNNKEKKDA